MGCRPTTREVPFETLLSLPLRNGLTKPKAQRGSGVKMISMGELFSSNRIGCMPMDRVPVTDKELELSCIAPSDLLFARQSLVLEGAGKCSFVKEVSEPTVFESHLIRARIDRAKAEPEYLYYFFKSPQGRERIASIVEQVAAAGIRGRDLARLSIPCPELDFQRRVVTLLSCIDNKIDANAKLNGYLLELLKASAKNLYAEYERNEELELPVGWRWIEVNEICEMVCRGITPKYNTNSDETVLGQTCVRNNLVLLENGRLHSPKKVTEKWLQKYDLLINSTGVGSLGRTAQVWFEPTKLVVDSHVTIVRCNDKKHALYLGFWAFEHEKYIESLHTGSTGQTELPRDHVKAIRLVLPSDEALERFNKMSAPSVELIVANQEESKRLADLRDALLPKLMSGRIDVSKIGLTQLNSHLA